MQPARQLEQSIRGMLFLLNARRLISSGPGSRQRQILDHFTCNLVKGDTAFRTTPNPAPARLHRDCLRALSEYSWARSYSLTTERQVQMTCRPDPPETASHSCRSNTLAAHRSFRIQNLTWWPWTAVGWTIEPHDWAHWGVQLPVMSSSMLVPWPSPTVSEFLPVKQRNEW